MSDNFKRGDLFTLKKQLIWDDGTPIDLTDVERVMFIMRLDGDVIPTVYDECIITSASDGEVEYVFKNGETDIAGMYRYEYEIHSVPLDDEEYRPYTVPSGGRYWIHIEEDVA